VTTINAPVAAASFADALDSIDQADSTRARVQAAADALYAFGFPSVRISLRDASLSPTLLVNVGDAVKGDGAHSLPGAVWRRRLAAIERFRSGDVYVLDGKDPWVAREFFGVDGIARPDHLGEWIATDVVIALIRGAEGELLGIVKLGAPINGARPDEARLREVGWLVRHLGARIAHDMLRAVAQRRAERLQRLQEAGAALARSLDEREVVWELARQTVRATRADGVVIAVPDLQADTLVTKLRLLRGSERARGVTPLGDGVIAEVARTGKPVRIGDRVADKARALAGASALSVYDVVGDAGPASSIVAVPLLMGIRLIAVVALHSAATEAFSPEDEEVVATMASQAATAIANARRYAESEQERRQTEALADVARAVGESLRPGDVLRLILRHSLSLLGAEGACIALRNDDYMHVVAAIGSAETLAGVHLPVAMSLTGTVAASGEGMFSNDVAGDLRASRSAQRLGAIKRTVITPLTTARGTIGTLAVINREAPFTDEDARVLQRLADHVAVAIVNARLFEGIEHATREWKVAFDAIATGMVVLDEQQRVTRCNARALELCGVQEFQALLGREFGDALLGQSAHANRAGLDALVAQALQSGDVARGSIRDDVGRRLLEVSISPHPDGGLVSTFDDVSPLQQLVAQQRRVEAQYERIVESASDSIFTTDIDGNFTAVNRALELATGRTREQLIGVPCMAAVDPEDEVMAAHLLRLTIAGDRQQAELRYRDDKGSYTRCLVMTSPIIEDGVVIGGLGIVREIVAAGAKLPNPLTSDR
jgi:PAS domain S-box-containing protein